jgi:hypothetical protein
MVFVSLILHKDGHIQAEATGHGTEVIDQFHAVSSLLLSPRGPWRIVEVNGSIAHDVQFDSDMSWTLRSELKNPEFINMRG